MTLRLSPRWQAGRDPAFDAAVERLRTEPLSTSEKDVLSGLWDAGEDARLREDERFRQTPWGRWVLAEGTELVNNQVLDRLRYGPAEGLAVDALLSGVEVPASRRPVFCPADSRFQVRDGVVRLAGFRPVDDPKWREELGGRLCAARARLLQARQADAPPGAEGAPGPARLVCIEAAAGGLHLEAGPVPTPSRVRLLAVVSGPSRWNVLASNLRQRTWRVPVAPSILPYRWTVPEFEDDLDGDLAPLEVPGLPAATPSVFRTGAAGVGRLLSGDTLSPGESYRVLLPPGLGPEAVPEGDAYPLAGGWRLWELAVPEVPGRELSGALALLGLRLAGESIRAWWAVTPPALYEETPAGQALPCFDPDTSPVLAIRADQPCAAGDLVTFLLAGDELRSLALPAGSDWALQLEGLPAGTHVLDLVHRSTLFEPVRLAFRVGPDERPAVPARFQVRRGESVHDPDAGGELVLEADLAALPDDGFALTAPPLWPVDVRWEGVRRERLGRLHAGPDGRLDGTELLARVGERRQAPAGDLWLDLGELGRVLVRHDRHATATELQVRLATHVAEREGVLAGLAGDLPLVRSLWLDPLLDLLGYEAAAPGEGGLLDPPPGATGLLLSSTRRERGRVTRGLRCVLVLAAAPADLAAPALRGYADRLCERHAAPAAILTDGLRWTRHRTDRRWHATTWDVRRLTEPGALERFEAFLYEFGG
jgi:hypothetical protein